MNLALLKFGVLVPLKILFRLAPWFEVGSKVLAVRTEHPLDSAEVGEVHLVADSLRFC